MKTWERCHQQKTDASCSHFSLTNSCLAFIIPQQERVSADPSEIRCFLEDWFICGSVYLPSSQGFFWGFFFDAKASRAYRACEHWCSLNGELPVRSGALLQLERCDDQTECKTWWFPVTKDHCWISAAFRSLLCHRRFWIEDSYKHMAATAKSIYQTSRDVCSVFLSKLKQLTTNSTCSSFHQEVSTLLKKQEPKLDVFSKTQGQKICSSGVNPKLVFHQSHSFPSFVPYLKGLMPIFLTLSPAAETLLLNGSYPDSDGDN